VRDAPFFFLRRGGSRLFPLPPFYASQGAEGSFLYFPSSFLARPGRGALLFSPFCLFLLDDGPQRALFSGI